MSDVSMELRHLALADRHLVRIRERIRQQLDIVRWYISRRNDPTDARALLIALRETEQIIRCHRHMILERLDEAHARGSSSTNSRRQEIRKTVQKRG